MTSNDTFGYTIVRLPTLGVDKLDADSEDRLIAQYKRYRLDSLQTDPDAFGSSYFHEVSQGRDFWYARLANQQARHFVAVSKNAPVGNPSEYDFDHDWYGEMVIVGPIFDIEGNAQTDPDSGSAASRGRYHFGAVHTAPQYRRKGISKSLLLEALENAEQSCRERKVDLFVDVQVFTANEGATSLYKAAGFNIVREEMHTPRAPGENGPRPAKPVYVMELRRPLNSV